MRQAFLLAGALLLGVAAGEWASRNFAARSLLGRLVRHDELVELVGRRGIYAHDPERSERTRAELVANAKIANAASAESLNQTTLNHELDLVRASLPNEKAWSALLQNAGSSPRRWRAEVAENLRSRQWLEARVAATKPPNDDEMRRYFETHRAEFQQPPRFRASHLFLAAPDGYPDEVISAKHQLIDALALRLQKGESFAALVAEFSEDEETKPREGDLNFFSEERMLPELFAAAQSLRVGETSTPVRSRLGFHLLQVTEALPAREMTLPEATPEIAARLENEHRADALRRLR